MQELFENKKLSETNLPQLQTAETSFNLCSQALNERYIAANLSEQIPSLKTSIKLGAQRGCLSGYYIGAILGLIVGTNSPVNGTIITKAFGT